MDKKSKTNDEEIKLRKRCIDLHKEGKNPTDIHRILHRTRDWGYQWLNRYKSETQNGILINLNNQKINQTKLMKSLKMKLLQSVRN